MAETASYTNTPTTKTYHHAGEHVFYVMPEDSPYPEAIRPAVIVAINAAIDKLGHADRATICVFTAFDDDFEGVESPVSPPTGEVVVRLQDVIYSADCRPGTFHNAFDRHQARCRESGLCPEPPYLLLDRPRDRP